LFKEMLFLKNPATRNLSHQLIQPFSADDNADSREDRIKCVPLALSRSVKTREYPSGLDLSTKTHSAKICSAPASISGISRQTLVLPLVRNLPVRTEFNAVHEHWRKGDGFSAVISNLICPEHYPVRIWWPMGISCFEHLFQRDGKQIREHALGLLSAPTLADAQGHARALSRFRPSLPQRRVLEAVNEVAFGSSARELLWGNTEFIDALRLRHIRSKAPAQGPRLFEISNMEWAGSLHWLGKQIERAKAQVVNEKTRRIATTAVASVAGYRAAIELINVNYIDRNDNYIDRRSWG
jgi:hypothetical protein